MLRIRSCLALTLFLCPILANADDLAEQVDAIFDAWDSTVSPGLALAVIQDGEILHKRGYGMANLEYGVPITPTTIFHVASVSKQFAAFAMILLEADGKLSLDDDIREYVPEVPAFGHTITIQHLINHTSGIRDQWELLILAGWRMDDVITQSDVLELVERQRELNFEPGSEYLYCNTGYTLLGVICERVTGKSLKDFCHERIFEPLGMRNTHFHDNHRHIVPNRAYSYAPAGNREFQHSVLSFAVAGATSLFTTVEDLALWQSNFDTAKVGGEKAIKRLVEQGVLSNGETIGYGMGLSHGTYKGLQTLNHGGADAGYRSYLVRFPSEKLSIAILGNLSSLNTGGLAFRVADLYLADAPREDSPAPAAAEDEGERDGDSIVTDAERYAGQYLNPRSNQLIRFVARDGELRYVQEMARPIPLKAVAEDRFRPAEDAGRFAVTFTTPEDGPILARFDLSGGRVETFEAVDEPDTTPEELNRLAGRYYSEELDVAYTVAFDGRQLNLVRRKYGAVQLHPRFADAFGIVSGGGGGLLRFTRNGNGEVDGFRINTGRIRNLRFVKAD